MEKQYHVLSAGGGSGLVRAATPKLAIAEFEKARVCVSQLDGDEKVGLGRVFQHSSRPEWWWFVEEACAVCCRQWHCVVSHMGTRGIVAADSVENAIRRAEYGPGAGAELVRDTVPGETGEWVRMLQRDAADQWWLVGPGAPAAMEQEIEDRERRREMQDGEVTLEHAYADLQGSYEALQEQVEGLRRERDMYKDWVDGVIRTRPRVGYGPGGEEGSVPPGEGQ